MTMAVNHKCELELCFCLMLMLNKSYAKDRAIGEPCVVGQSNCSSRCPCLVTL